MKFNIKANQSDYEIMQMLAASEAEAIKLYSEGIEKLSMENSKLKNLLADQLNDERKHWELLELAASLCDQGGVYNSNDPDVNKEMNKLLK